MPNKLRTQKIAFSVLTASAILILLIVSSVLYFVLSRGSNVLSWEFLTQPPKHMMTEGGIFPALFGTFLLGIGAMIFSIPFGVLTAVYLNEFSTKRQLSELLRSGIATLSGLPSIVYGLFGFAIFCKLFGFGVSVLSGALTLAIMSLPLVIVTTEEALRSVPDSFRQASLALGVSKWVTIKKVVLPNAISGIITGSILAMGRAVGETAPIMFTAATFFTRSLPKSPFDEVMALPYHIYGLVTEGIFPAKQLPIAFGSALVLLLLVMTMSAFGIAIRTRARLRRKW
jgi:phosphate transport system permease protein